MNRKEKTRRLRQSSLYELFQLFFKLGIIAFGGPAAHIAMMEQEVVEKRKWTTGDHFLDLIGATSLIPGPNSTQLSMHIGYERAGFLGLVVAGMSFIFPAAFLTGVLAWFYKEYGSIPSINPFFWGIKAAIIAVILGAVYSLGKKALKNIRLWVLGIIVTVAVCFGVNEILALFSVVILAFLFVILSGVKTKKIDKSQKKEEKKSAFSFVFLSLIPAAGSVYTPAKLFFVFLKIGSILFGSGYVLIAYLEGELVEKLGWLTKTELLDAIALGQFTPGPVLTTSTFIGYYLGDLSGAFLATLGIFLPSFVFVGLLNPIIPKLRKSSQVSSVLDSVNVASLAVMLGVTIQLMIMLLVDQESKFLDFKNCLLFLLGVIAVFGPKKISPFWIVVGASVLGYLFYLLGW